MNTGKETLPLILSSMLKTLTFPTTLTLTFPTTVVVCNPE